MGHDKLFGLKSNIQLKMYKTVSQGAASRVTESLMSAPVCLELLPTFRLQPLLLNEVLVKMSPDPSSDEPLFHVSHIDRVYTLKTETLNERCASQCR